MVRRTLLAAVLLMLSGLLIAAVVVAAHMRSEREREEARVTHLQASIVQLNRRLRTSDQIIGSCSSVKVLRALRYSSFRTPIAMHK